ncbi:MAG: 16S rRNA (uracil(1498)-N(3))-methyltransferase [bacterium]
MSGVVCTLWPREGAAPAAGVETTLGPEESRHLVKVRRVRTGEEVWAAVGDGRGVRCVVISDERDAAGLRAEEVVTGWREPVRRVALALGMVRPQHMETALTEGTALGLHRFIPLFTERVEHRRHRPDRWDRLAAEAVKQCGRGWVPPVEAPLALETLIESRGERERLLVADAGAPSGLRDVLSREGVAASREILLVVGPEGDLSPRERDLLQGAGGIPFHLGPRRLRSETASLAALAVLLAG